MIGVLDYGVGNVGSILNSLKAARVDATAANRPEILADCDRFVLPGVGAFDHAVGLLRSSGMLDELLVRVEDGAHFLGICVGMQILSEGSDEGASPGLGLIPGRVVSIPLQPGTRPGLPHLGWNAIKVGRPTALLDGLDQAEFYFMHSFRFECKDASNRFATADYGTPIEAVVGNGRVFGVQFHPEKSHKSGSLLLSNFVRLS